MVPRGPGLLSFLTLLVICLVQIHFRWSDGDPNRPRDEHHWGVIAGVKVEATHVETNVSYRGETNDEGLYNIPALPPGTYRVMVQKFAFITVLQASRRVARSG